MGRVWRVVMILLVGVSLVGCGGAKATTTKAPKKKPAKKKKVETVEKKPPQGKTKIGGVFGGFFLDDYRTARKKRRSRRADSGLPGTGHPRRAGGRGAAGAERGGGRRQKQAGPRGGAKGDQGDRRVGAVRVWLVSLSPSRNGFSPSEAKNRQESACGGPIIQMGIRRRGPVLSPLRCPLDFSLLPTAALGLRSPDSCSG